MDKIDSWAVREFNENGQEVTKTFEADEIVRFPELIGLDQSGALEEFMYGSSLYAFNWNREALLATHISATEPKRLGCKQRHEFSPLAA